ncbi:MAG: ribonuclease III [Acidobacteria bacterium]|nr:ribonuclease III [Acidobacteriota bacterium]
MGHHHQSAPGDISELEARLGYCFAQRGLIEKALTHRSHLTGQTGGPRHASNELLEYLGDSVLALLVSETLIQRHPLEGEGDLSKRRSRLVSEAHLYQAAERLGLGAYLRLGRGEERAGGRGKKALLADAMEALLAAVYLDGGLEPAREFVKRLVLEPVDGEALPATDYKTELQEALQERKLTAPRYVVVKESGPEHRKIFTVQVLIQGEAAAVAEGETKKAAQQAAARIALGKVRQSEKSCAEAE